MPGGNDRDCDRGDDVVASSACGRGYDVASLRPGHYEVSATLRLRGLGFPLRGSELRQDAQDDTFRRKAESGERKDSGGQVSPDVGIPI